MEKKETTISFAVCVANTGYEDLEVCKVYRFVADVKAAEVGCLRVIDQSGEDYSWSWNYPKRRGSDWSQ